MSGCVYRMKCVEANPTGRPHVAKSDGELEVGRMVYEKQNELYLYF